MGRVLPPAAGGTTTIGREAVTRGGIPARPRGIPARANRAISGLCPARGADPASAAGLISIPAIAHGSDAARVHVIVVGEEAGSAYMPPPDRTGLPLKLLEVYQVAPLTLERVVS